MSGFLSYSLEVGIPARAVFVPAPGAEKSGPAVPFDGGSAVRHYGGWRGVWEDGRWCKDYSTTGSLTHTRYFYGIWRYIASTGKGKVR